MTGSPFVGDLTWSRVAERVAGGAIAILPVGAGSKQHGLHMPMATDRIVAEYFARELAKKIDALIWPTVTYGSYPAFTAYAGSVTLNATTFSDMIRDIVEGLIAFDARAILILNTGLSTITPINRALERVSAPARMRHIALFSGPAYQRAVASVCHQTYGSHADEPETSMMLAIAPEWVDMQAAQDSPALPDGPVDGPLTPRDVTSPNYSASGSFGRPTLATREKGLVLIAAILTDLEAAVSAL